MSIRLRLTLWYGILLTLSLLLFDLLIYGLMAGHLFDMVDDELRRQAGQAVRIVGRDPSELDSLPDPSDVQALQALLDFFRSPSSRVALIDGEGALIARSPAGAEIPPERRAKALELVRRGSEGLGNQREGTTLWRVYARRMDGLGARWGLAVPPVLLIDARVDTTRFTLTRLGIYLAAGTLFILGLGTWVSWRLASAPLRPIAQATTTARAIAASRSFTRRLAAPAVSGDEVGELITTLNEMLESLEQSYESQKQFVANASHELRAPLTTLQGNLSLLKKWDRLDPPDREAVLDDLRSEVERMTRLVSDLLALARADAGEVARTRTVELDGLGAEVFRSFRLRAERHRFRMGRFEPVCLQGDPDLLKQLLVILLDNAFQYTPAGGRVELSVYPEGAHAVIEVSDTGIGIAAEDLPHIFERFYRADRARTRSTESTGLGLSIAQWIVETHGGSIEVQSAPWAGSRFRVNLPRERVASPTTVT